MLGRSEEIKELRELYKSNKAEFVAIYGIRKLGKTELVETAFENDFAFKFQALSPDKFDKAEIETAQLKSFGDSLETYGLSNVESPEDWHEAFSQLKDLLEAKGDGKRQIVFIDNLQCLKTGGSGFADALGDFWKNWGAANDNLMLIVCSCTWMLDKLASKKDSFYSMTTRDFSLHNPSLEVARAFYIAKANRIDGKE